MGNRMLPWVCCLFSDMEQRDWVGEGGDPVLVLLVPVHFLGLAVEESIFRSDMWLLQKSEIKHERNTSTISNS